MVGVIAVIDGYRVTCVVVGYLIVDVGFVGIVIGISKPAHGACAVTLIEVSCAGDYTIFVVGLYNEVNF